MVHVVSLCMIDLLNRLCECIELLDCNQICVCFSVPSLHLHVIVQACLTILV